MWDLPGAGLKPMSAALAGRFLNTAPPGESPEYTFFSSTHGTFSRIDHILGHKRSLNKFKRLEIISSIFSDYNGMKLEINHRKRNEKKKITRRLKNMLLNNQWVNDEIKEEKQKNN